jgi:hypothetical protein
MTLDHLRVRQHQSCPLCHRAKGFGLLVCWPCFRAYDLRNGNPLVDRRLDAAEANLAVLEASNTVKGH